MTSKDEIVKVKILAIKEYPSGKTFEVINQEVDAVAITMDKDDAYNLTYIGFEILPKR